MQCIESSHVRSLLVITDKESKIFFEDKIPKNFKLLRVLDCNSDSLMSILKNLGNFIHLKYLSLGYVEISEISKSIGMLRNLETLNIQSRVKLPKETRKLGKLRHLTCMELSLIQLEDGIGEMTSLQTLHCGEDGIILSSSNNEMKHLEKLDIQSRLGIEGLEVIDLDLISLPTKLRKLTLTAKLQKLPEWIPKLQNLVELTFWNLGLTEDPFQSLKSLQNLLCLSLHYLAYEGCFNFEDGCFQKLKKLDVYSCYNLREVVIDKGALPSLKKLEFNYLQKLENIPTGIQHLEKLEDLRIVDMSNEFVQNISTEDWNSMQHVPLVHISGPNGISNRRS